MQRADQRKFHYIYKITRNDGRYYIGMHSTDNLEDGYFGSGKKITRSIKKYGLEKHKKEILEFLPSREALRNREEQLVTEEVVNDPLCMNIATGGHPSGFFSEEHHRKFFSAAALTGKTNGPRTLNILRNRDPEFQLKISSAGGKVSGPKVGPLAVKNMQTVEANQKRKATFTERGHAQGQKNSQFGTCWVTNGTPIKIKKKQLDEFLSNGYLRGRK